MVNWQGDAKRTKVWSFGGRARGRVIIFPHTAWLNFVCVTLFAGVAASYVDSVTTNNIRCIDANLVKTCSPGTDMCLLTCIFLILNSSCPRKVSTELPISQQCAKEFHRIYIFQICIFAGLSWNF